MKNRAAIDRLAVALRNQAALIAHTPEIQFFLKTLENLSTLEELRATSNYGLRDRKMADNLVWLANEWYRGRKMILWAASAHVARNLDRIDTRTPQFSYRDVVSMGQVVHERLGKAVYTVGFIAYRGQRGTPMMPQPVNLEPPSADSLETLFHAAGHRYAFVDFRGLPSGHWLPRARRPASFPPA